MRRRLRERAGRLFRAVVKTAAVFAVLGGVIAIGAHFYGFTRHSDFFRLREVTVTGVSPETEAEMRALLADITEGERTLFGVSTGAIRARLEQHPRLDPRSLSIRRRWPHTLAIEAAEREPVAAVAGPRLMLIDAEGWIIEQSAEAVALADVPVLTGVDPSELLYGDRLTDRETQTLLTWLAALRFHVPRMHRQLAELHIAPSGEVTAHLVGGTVVRLGDRGPRHVMPVLLSFTRVIEEDLSRLALLDLRMDDHLVYRRREAPTLARAD